MPVHVPYHDSQRCADETDTERSPQSQSPGFVMVSPRYPMPRAQQRAPSTADRPHRPHLRHHNRHRGSIILHPQPQIPRHNRHSGPITHTEGATTCTLNRDYPATRPPEEGYPPPQHIRGNRSLLVAPGDEEAIAAGQVRLGARLHETHARRRVAQRRSLRDVMLHHH